jgi:hypothetical protein
MSDNDEPKQQPTPSKTPKRPNPPERSDSDASLDDPGYQSRSRSQSRRRRRQNQRQRALQQQQQQQDGGGGKAQAQSMAKIDEEKGPQAQSQSETTMQPFERIGMLTLAVSYIWPFSPRIISYPETAFCPISSLDLSDLLPTISRQSSRWHDSDKLATCLSAQLPQHDPFARLLALITCKSSFPFSLSSQDPPPHQWTVP